MAEWLAVVVWHRQCSTANAVMTCRFDNTGALVGLTKDDPKHKLLVFTL
jgi:hypothetical protein